MYAKLFIAKTNVQFMDRSLNVCKTFHDKTNVRFMDQSLNLCKTFNTELEIIRKVFETNGMPYSGGIKGVKQ